ncbi:hypothetical protein [Streptosporangium longisporum]|uniref:hypothetical protein n=1 Tax=Streptosporangium longisporum TaxID=46187 RepID=UPI0031EE2F09
MSATLMAVSSPVLVAVMVYSMIDPGSGSPPPTTVADLVAWMFAWRRATWAKIAWGQ